MKDSQRGVGMVSGIMTMAIIGGVAAVAIPAYDDFLIRSKITEAFTLAGDTKNRVTEFYATTARFPKREREREMMRTEAYTPPEFVHNISLAFKHPQHDVVIQIYFKDGAIPGAIFQDDFVYMGGSVAPDGIIEWRCGAEGIADEFLPERCQSNPLGDKALMEKYDMAKQQDKEKQIEGARDRMPSDADL